MSDSTLLDRIVCSRSILTGKPVIRGTRLSVAYILNRLAHGAREQDLLAEYDGLTPDDVRACLLFAAESLSSAAFLPLAPEPV